MKTLTADARKAVQADLGLTDEQMDTVIQSVLAKNKETPAGQLDKQKSAAAEAAVEKAATEVPDVAVVPTELEKALASLKEAQAEIAKLKEAAPVVAAPAVNPEDIETLVRNSLKSILGGAASGTITKPTQAAAAINDAEKAKLTQELQVNTAAKSERFANDFDESFYNRFTSKSK